MYDFTEYRVLNDSINICNSTDNYVQDSGKLRNGWVKKERYLFSCKTLIRKYQQTNFTVQKDLGVRLSLPRQVISNSDYGVYEGEIRICM